MGKPKYKLLKGKLTAPLIFLLLTLICLSLAVWAVTKGPLSYLSKGAEITSESVISSPLKGGKNLIKNGNFEQESNLIGKYLTPANLQGLAPFWKQLATSKEPIEFSLTKEDKYSQSQKIHTQGINDGISQTIGLPKDKPLVLTAFVKVMEGKVIVSFGPKQRIIEKEVEWQKITLLSVPQELGLSTEISFASAVPKTIFLVDEVTVYELNMTKGEMLQDKIISPTISSKTVILSDGVSQTIPVTIGISLQVVANHCDTVNSLTNRCSYVEQLAMRDFQAMQGLFTGTLKTFVFTTFDAPWNETQEQGCDRASGGQSLPYLECHHERNTIYVAILYVPQAAGSGGEADLWRVSARYVAPARFEETDYWQNNSDQAIGVLTHEIGHLFGQIHTPSIQGDLNAILPGVDYQPYYYGDLATHPLDSPQREWVMELTRHSSIPTDFAQAVYNNVPQNIILNLRDPDGSPYLEGTVTIYGSDIYQGWQGARGISSTPLASNLSFTDSSINIPGDLLNYAILLLQIQGLHEPHYLFLTVMEANLAYWQGATEVAQFSKNTFIPLPIRTTVRADFPTSAIQLISVSIEKRNADGSWSGFATRYTENPISGQIYSYIFRVSESTATFRLFVYAFDRIIGGIPVGEVVLNNCSGNMVGNICELQAPGAADFVISVPPPSPTFTPTPTPTPQPGTISGKVMVISNASSYWRVSVFLCELIDPNEPSKGDRCNRTVNPYDGPNRTDTAEFPYNFDSVSDGQKYSLYSIVSQRQDGVLRTIGISNHNTDCPSLPGSESRCVVTAPGFQNFTITLPTPSPTLTPTPTKTPTPTLTPTPMPIACAINKENPCRVSTLCGIGRCYDQEWPASETTHDCQPYNLSNSNTSQGLCKINLFDLVTCGANFDHESSCTKDSDCPDGKCYIQCEGMGTCTPPSTPTPSQTNPKAADLNQDGKITLSDFLLALQNYGVSVQTLSGETQVNAHILSLIISYYGQEVK